MSAPSDPQAAALLTHVISQMQQNVDFLVSQNYISSADASAIVSRLPTAAIETNGFSRTAGAAARGAPPPARRSVPQPPAPPRGGVVQARAIWAYNEDGKEPDDLAFAAGDIIEIVAETNADWWMGKVHGKQALFPSSYVEKISSQSGPAPIIINEKAGSKYASRSYDQPPVGPDESATNPLGLQPAPGQEEKKKGFSKYKSTIAHSAAGGVGFGAGAAIGGGLVRAIF